MYFHLLDDINEGRISYELRPENYHLTRDEVMVNVKMDHSSSMLKDIIFKIAWSWLEVEKETYSLYLSEKKIQVKIIKFGGIEQPSSVECTASLGSQNIKSLVKFQEGQNSSSCIIDLSKYPMRKEKNHIVVVLSNAQHSFLRKKTEAIINFKLKDDRTSFVTFDSPTHVTRENSEMISIPVTRNGDIEKSASVMCSTKDKTAFGGNSLDMLGYDFLRRPISNSSIIVFSPGEKRSMCRVSIFDDDKFESLEIFELHLSNPSEGLLLGEISVSTIKVDGPNDMSVFAMKDSLIFVNPREEEIEIIVERSGEDMEVVSSVWCELINIGSAEDDVETSQLIVPPHSKSGVCKFPSYLFKHQSNQEFHILLINPKNATIDSSADKTKIIIISKQDTSVIQFGRSLIVANEPQGIIDIPIVRNGNLSVPISVNCFTKQRTATPGEDYIDRPKIRNSTVVFQAERRKALCRINLIDDATFEPDEILLVKLAHPDGNGIQKVSLGKHKVARIRIKNDEDQPKIRFMQDHYTIDAPVRKNVSQFFIELERKGDVSKISRIRIITSNKSARAGTNYIALDDIIHFDAQQIR